MTDKFLGMSRADLDKFFEELPPDKSSTLLVEHLMKKKPSEVRDKIIERAKNMEFDDFKSPHAAPKIELYSTLRKAGYADLAVNVTLGVYDSK